MKFISFLNEMALLGTFKNSHRHKFKHQIFQNPTKEDYEDYLKYNIYMEAPKNYKKLPIDVPEKQNNQIQFLADLKNKNFYVAPGELYPENLYDELKNMGKIQAVESELFFGADHPLVFWMAKIMNNYKLEMYQSIRNDGPFKWDILKQKIEKYGNLNWLEQWFQPGTFNKIKM